MLSEITDSNCCIICFGDELLPLGKNILFCKQCKTAINQGYKEGSYGPGYFLNDYKKQYGKTYEEDFHRIYTLSSSRLQRILLHMRTNKKQNELQLLDIGSAMGFFLKCALDHNIGKVTGIERSRYASEYTYSKFKIKTIHQSFENVKTDRTYDIVTAWFFLEHNRDPLALIKKMYSLVNDHGILAMSIPSTHGPLFYFNRKEWINTHPIDHRVDFSPRSIKLLLKNAGFKKIKVHTAGFHPERIMNTSNPLFYIFSKLYRLFTYLSAFSDTIEVYAVK